jgi:hypothetical protein
MLCKWAGYVPSGRKTSLTKKAPKEAEETMRAMRRIKDTAPL